jgi:hypothetical protein
VVAPALAHALGDFAPGVDDYTFAAFGQIVLLVPFTSMFAGINVIVDKDFGILRDFLVAPIRRPTIPLANALGVRFWRGRAPESPRPRHALQR